MAVDLAATTEAELEVVSEWLLMSNENFVSDFCDLGNRMPMWFDKVQIFVILRESRYLGDVERQDIRNIERDNAGTACHDE